MKKLKIFKSILFMPAFIASIFLMSSCTENKQMEDTKDIAEEHNEAKFDNNTQQKDAQFLVNAAEINLEEIRLGQLAQKMAITDDAKDFGKMLENTHTKAQRELSGLAKSKMVTIPTTPTDNSLEAYQELSKESGIAFDRAYMDMVVKHHENAISVFQDASTKCSDTDIKDWALSSLTDLRTHLDRSLNLQRSLENR